MMRHFVFTGTLLVVLASSVECFQPPKFSYRPRSIFNIQSKTSHRRYYTPISLASSDNSNNEEKEGRDLPKKGFIKRVVSKVPRLLRARKSLRLAIAIVAASLVGGVKVPVARASAPVMAIPKAEGRDPATEALGVHDRKMAAQTQRELTEMAQQARKIEAEQGEAARVKFEKEYKMNQEAKAEARKVGLEQLKRDLLDQGICPFTDLEGQRQVTEYTRGVDLGKVPGTVFYMEKEWELKSPNKSMKVRKAANRGVIACMVQDMKNRDIDPLEYFDKHKDQTEAILDMEAQQAARLLQQYKANLEEYGQIVPPKEGELSVKEKMAKAGTNKKAAKEEAQRLKAAAKAKAAELKAAAKAEKQRLKEEAAAKKLQAKEAAKEAKEKTKQAAAASAGAAAAAGAGAASAAATAADAAQGVVQDSLPTLQEPAAIEQSATSDETMTEMEAPSVVSSKKKSNTVSIAGKEIPRVAATAAVITVAGGGAGYAFKVYRDKAAADEEERQRQFRLLMGEEKDVTDKKNNKDQSSAPSPLEEVDTDMKGSSKASGSSRPKSAPPAPESVSETPAAPAKKRRLGIKSVFGKKKNERETDLMVLVSDDAAAPEFTRTLAKMLTFGAPGRFPSVLSLPGGTLMAEFELEQAKQILTRAQTDAGLTLEESAEVFANVVNCMLIDIVDLASTSLKEKDDTVTADAVNIVVDFMNHAASLYDSIAEGVSIKPVTYGGDLSKSKLEQMFSKYVAQGMAEGAMSMMPTEAEDGPNGDFDSRISMLQDVFQINSKKAEGLMQKAMQKKMMDMLKGDASPEAMEEMMKGLGLDGSSLLGGADGEPPNPEQIKEMLLGLKELKDSGQIPPEEMEQVKKDFQDAFGTSIDEIVKAANDNNEELSQTDRELVDLMKSVME